jgi:hypothetical protein
VSNTTIEKRFSDLDQPDQPYPGRRKPVNRDAPTAPPPVETAWDAKPVYYKFPGQPEKQPFFTISHLAKALGYSVQSVRAWEAQGLLPRSGIRGPRTTRPVAAGRSTKGKRLWTREQIETILRLAKEHKVLVNREPPTPAFCRDVARHFEEMAG